MADRVYDKSRLVSSHTAGESEDARRAREAREALSRRISAAEIAAVIEAGKVKSKTSAEDYEPAPGDSPLIAASKRRKKKLAEEQAAALDGKKP